MFSISDGPLDFQDAVVILSHVRHNGYGDWYIRDRWKDPRDTGADPYVGLEQFEAVAAESISEIR